jgi:hypothetical protein
MCIEMQGALSFVDRAECVRYEFRLTLASITRLCPPGTRTMTSAKPALVVRPADLGLEIAMFAETAAFEHIPQLLFPQRPRASWCIAERVDQLGGLRRDPLGAALHRLDMA